MQLRDTGLYGETSSLCSQVLHELAWNEAVLWLTDAEPVERPAHVPEPAGSVLATYCTQSGVPEQAGIQGPIWGILSLRTV